MMWDNLKLRSKSLPFRLKEITNEKCITRNTLINVRKMLKPIWREENKF